MHRDVQELKLHYSSTGANPESFGGGGCNLECV